MKKLLNIFSLLLLGISAASQANLQECKFYGHDDLLIMSPGTVPVITPLPVGTVTTPTLISTTIIMETTPALKSHCAGGNDGEDVYQMTNNAMLDGYIDDKATFRTNIPGIVYTLAFYPDGNGVTAWFPLNANAFYKTAIGEGNEAAFDEKTWHVRMEFWQTNGFTGVPDDENFLTAGSGPIGQIVLGNPDGTSTDDHPRPLVNMSQMSFSIPLNRPTCVLRAPTTVNLGDWYPGEVENGNTDQVEFHITGTCVNTKTVYYTLSSTHTTTDKNYFTNSISNTGGVSVAGGVGVMIKSQPESSYPVPADSYKRVLAVGEMEGDVHFVDKTLAAKLVKVGSDPVTVGTFGTTVTFQITYE
ncbi:fimbrial protein StkG [Enterobacter asburiae]|jgi:type 1 fimbria pilin|uniref:fimbrial protein StkG n=1 Tax=Enterobacter TaxID=547 RepID=UPI001BD64C99|nr:fimbrial protein StkG [Enterobacter asburiae]EHN8921888.1 fimbrial protein StkG [Enterobacter asburiae]ELH8608349.1 fimbrial protein StkG [Enterobacter asburiae]MCS5454224.1 fimbrial protein StkG [Enterobacter asburiae]HDV9840930.1 fimbrial protein StkG [Enterobacter asburiae]